MLVVETDAKGQIAECIARGTSARTNVRDHLVPEIAMVSAKVLRCEALSSFKINQRPL